MKVSQIMQRSAQSCDANQTLDAAARIMWENDCGSVPVTDSVGRLVGILTDRDICMAAYLQGGPLHTLYVGSAMANQVFSCTPDDSLAECHAIMREHQVRRLPVVDGDGKLVGMLSLHDLVRNAANEPRRGKVSFADVGETLQAVSKPRRGTALASVA